jgi:hypothetical protein
MARVVRYLVCIVFLSRSGPSHGSFGAVAADERDAVVEAVTAVAGVDDLDRRAVRSVGDAQDAHERAADRHVEQLGLALAGRQRLQVLVGLGDAHAGGVQQRVQRRILGAQAVGVDARARRHSALEQRRVHADRLAVDEAHPDDLEDVDVRPEPATQRRRVAAGRRRPDRDEPLRRDVPVPADLVGERAELRLALDETRLLHERAPTLLAPHETGLLEMLERADRSRATDAVPADELGLARHPVPREQVSAADAVRDLLGELDVERPVPAAARDADSLGHAVDRSSYASRSEIASE